MTCVRRIRLDLAYDGTQFSGWAAQPGQRTVEGVLTEALATVLREEVRLTVAGRTDAGVHAAGQVAHFDCSADAWLALPGRSDRAPADALIDRLHGIMTRGGVPPKSSDIVVHRAEEVSRDFDARFAAIGRSYRYRITDLSAGGFDPLTRHCRWWVREHLAADAMQAAADHLIGEWDFAALCKPREGATTIRRLLTCAVTRSEAGIEIDLAADAFCHSMVRSIVGCLVEVGRGKKSPDWMGEVLARKDRSLAAAVAPAHGLTLTAVRYPPPEQWAARQEATRQVRTSAAGRGSAD